MAGEFKDLSKPASTVLTCARGTEGILGEELRELGIGTFETNTGFLTAELSISDLSTIAAHSRLAQQAFRVIKKFSATHSVMLYDQVRRLGWEDLIPLDKTFRVDAVFSTRMRGEEMRNPMGAALKIKDAIVDRIRMKMEGARPNVSPENPDLIITAHFRDGFCTLGLDAFGRSLHQRGYRGLERSGPAPLKENLAVACLKFLKWQPEIPLLDPFCGSGTFLIEAALWALNREPRLPFKPAFRNWPGIQDDVRPRRMERKPLPDQVSLLGFDSHENAIRIARKNAGRAHVEKFLILNLGRAESIGPPKGIAKGMVIANPPYGERLGEATSLGELYEKWGKNLKENYRGWKLGLISGNAELTQRLKLRAKEKHVLFNGPIECRFLVYDIGDKSL